MAQHTVNGKQVLDVLTTSVIDEEILDQYEVLIEREDGLFRVDAVRVEASAVPNGPTIRRIILREWQ